MAQMAQLSGGRLLDGKMKNIVIILIYELVTLNDWHLNYLFLEHVKLI